MESTDKGRELTRFFSPNDAAAESKDGKPDGTEAVAEFPNVVGQQASAGVNERLVYSRTELLAKFVEVEHPSQELIKNLKENKIVGLGKHIVSHYVIRPVACDKNPFNITHVNPYNEAQMKKHQFRTGPPRFTRGSNLN